MIKSIQIKNIQSHKDTSLEFSPGINAIVGSSNNGKSAVLRALYWARYNRPLGTDTLLSHWAVDKKGNQIAPMEVCVENDFGVVTRRRTKDENQYIVNDEELNVVKTDVPAEVESLFRLSDTNIQKQQDAPFLLSLSSGQVAQYFNKTVRLDIIDRVLSNAENKRRKTNQEIAQTEDLCSEYKQKREKYSWLDDVEKLLIKYDNVCEKNNEIKTKYDLLQQQIDSYKKFAALQKKFNFINDANQIINKIEKLDATSEELNNKINVLQESLDNFASCKTYPSFDEQKKLIEKIESLNTNNIENEINYISEKIVMFNELEHNIKGCKINAEELKKQLPNICPLCGAVMKEGVCENE